MPCVRSNEIASLFRLQRLQSRGIVRASRGHSYVLGSGLLVIRKSRLLTVRVEGAVGVGIERRSGYVLIGVLEVSFVEFIPLVCHLKVRIIIINVSRSEK